MKRVLFVAAALLALADIFHAGALYTNRLCAQDAPLAQPGFMGIRIGMSRGEVLSYADSSGLIEVPKNKDVEFFPVEERKILTLSIKPEVPHIYLQFYGDTLYAITVIFDEKYVDYFALARSLASKYGRFAGLTPTSRRWEREGVEIKLEKPAVVKYIALKEFLEVTGFTGQKALPGQERKKLLLEGL